MLGHQLFLHLSRSHDVRVTVRKEREAYGAIGLFNSRNARFGVDVRDFAQVEKIALAMRPDAIVNAIGIVKQRGDAEDTILNIEVNSLLPHRLAALSERLGARLVHLSTDCVFDGKRGLYTEEDVPSAEDIYGRSKLLGEVSGPTAITLRTSMIGQELFRKEGLLEWFLAQQGEVRGFTNAVFSGFTTIELARIVGRVLMAPAGVHGTYHVSAAPISKFDLISLIKKKLGLSIRIVPDGRLRIDRSLDSRRFRREFGYRPPTWNQMIGELADRIEESRK